MAKLIQISDTLAWRVEGVKIEGKKRISLRQMYRKKSEVDDDTAWKPGRNGVTLAVKSGEAEKIARTIGKMALNPDTKYKTLEIQRKKKKDEDDED